MFCFKDKIVVVTGSSRGIGKTIAKRFYMAGASVGVCSRNQAELEQAVFDISHEDNPRRIYCSQVDVSNVAQLHTYLREVVDHFGRIDILVNNAGVQFPQPSIDVGEDIWDATIDINLKGYFFASQFAARDMISRGEPGCIVNIGSVNAVTIVVEQAVYAASKAAISQMTRSLAREWGRYNIRINCIAPGSIPTAINAAIYADKMVLRKMEEKIPMGRRGTTEEIADSTLYIASDYASYITGQTLFVDGGLTLAYG